MRNIILTTLLAFLGLTAMAQTGIGTPNPDSSAQLHIEASDKGVLIPQVAIESLTDQTAIAGNDPAESLLIFNPTDTNGVAVGYYYWLAGKWEFLAPDSSTYANVYYNGDTFYYRKEDGTKEEISIESLIQSKQITYEVVGDDAYVSVTEVVQDPDAPDYNANHTTFKVEVKAAMPEFFYLPTLLLDTSELGVETLDLHAAYVAQFGTPAVKNNAAPEAIPHLPNAEDLHYYITDFDTDVIEPTTLSISDQGVLTYDVIGNAGPYSYITVIFVVK